MTATVQAKTGPDDRTVTELLAAYRTGFIFPRDAVEGALSRACLPSARGVFVSLDGPDVCAAAKSSTERWMQKRSSGPLDGVPIALKDNIDQRNHVTLAGAAIRRAAPPATENADIVAKLEALDAICFGRTSMPEFAFSGMGINPHFGTPANASQGRNRRIPGGSSSGSAVAVALGIVPAAIGTDTSGSVRVPAALNGVVGFRPSWNRYPIAGVFPLAPSLDTLGLLASTAVDCLLLDNLLNDSPVGEDTLPTISFIVPSNIVLDDLDESVARGFAAAVDQLRRTGFKIGHRAIESFDIVASAMDRHGTWVTAEAYDTLWPRIGKRADRLDPQVRRRLAAGGRQTRSDRKALSAARQHAKAALAETLGDSFLLFPTVAAEAPPIEAVEHDDQLFTALNNRILRNTMLGSVLDTPAISLPFTLSGEAPIGLQISALPGRDCQLLATAVAVEAALRGRQ
ncbi:MAG: amidase family protein [Phyllobacteriaceae bacterium]|nr:amidase family protein [Phyllobacteriaceae bacterium]